ncbi:hypothetical protein [Mesorhizobium sp. WSM3873]|uniref:hypothetical protein n=1 Tax=Mesorhizobium sp. WSM3873 TaxID=1854056 RepID=UPI001FDAACEF|nr:hypothetical protein [Mesorhizobium sp. WSM3873]
MFKSTGKKTSGEKYDVIEGPRLEVGGPILSRPVCWRPATRLSTHHIARPPLWGMGAGARARSTHKLLSRSSTRRNTSRQQNGLTANWEVPARIGAERGIASLSRRRCPKDSDAKSQIHSAGDCSRRCSRRRDDHH